MTLATTFLASALVVPNMPPPEYDDCEVVTNCVFDSSRDDAKVFSGKIELDATPSNVVVVVFGRDTDGDGILSRLEERMAVGYDCGEWKVVNLAIGDKFSCADESGRVTLDWKLRLNADLTPRSLVSTVNGQPTFPQLATPPPSFLFDPTGSTNDFRIVSVELVDGKPKVEWEPKVNRWTGAEIQAVLKGAESLDGDWHEVDKASESDKAKLRFFKVVVELP